MLCIEQQMNELIPTDYSVAVFIYFLENSLDVLFWLLFVFQEEGYLIIGNLARVIDIEVLEGLLKMFLRKKLLYLQTSHNELSQVDETWTVGIDHPHQQTHPRPWNVDLRVQSVYELDLADDPVIVLIQLLKQLSKDLFLFSCHELWDDEGIDYCF